MKSDKTPAAGTSNPESLHQMGRGTEQMSMPQYLNPGTPESALVRMEDRKSGRAPGANEDMLRAHARGNNV